MLAAPANGAPTRAKLARAAHASTLPGGLRAAPKLPQGVPTHGRYAFLLKLSAKSTSSVFATKQRSAGRASARSAARAQLRTVRSAQSRAVAALPAKSKVLYRTHAALAGVAVVTDVRNYAALTRISGVSAVYPIAPKAASNSYAVPLQGGATAWDTYGDRGENATIAVIDTGVDYTHANFGGPGTVQAYDTAKAHDTSVPDPASYDHAKFNATTLDVDGHPAYMYDFAGDDYDADPNSDTYQPVPHPDPNPLDCNSHGSHVAGTAAGYGENADGSTYTGAYDADTPFDTLRIGPGMAPKARLYAFKVFGCEGSTDVTGQAIDKAMDPNGDGDTSDHADVVNMSLGSDYGFPDDGDSVLTNEASKIAGVTMVVASGNGGDIYDIGGSPGNAVRAIAVANSQDVYSQVDALEVSAPSTIDGSYASLRSVAYDWQHEPDLGGDVVQLTQPGNPEGCQPITGQYAAAINGHIAFVEWTDDDATRPCGSVARAANLVAAGATGFIFGDDAETFSAGITGATEIPGVLVAKSGADAIRSELVAGHTVTISGTTLNGFAQTIPGLDDTVNTSSSRGIRDAGNVKPDVTAVGTTVFSTGMGTGNEGLNDSGTSMATPMVAGTAALVISKHPEWTPEQVKADIMNTADQDLYTGNGHTGTKYGPNRVGAGRIDVPTALDNQVLAYTTDGPGGTSTGNVSASFGPMALPVNGGTVVRTKTIKVQNTGLDPVTYATGFADRTTIPGVSYAVSPATVTVGPQSSASVTLTLTVNPKQLTKTIDPTVDRVTGELPRQYLADASGLVTFTSQTNGAPDLRVPAYAAPRPASTMTQPASVALPKGAVQQALLPLSGQQVQQGSGATAIQSLVAGFELQAVSGRAPKCTARITSGCWDSADQRVADLKYVASTSDAPQLRAAGQNPLTDGEAYFSITTQVPFRHPGSPQEYDIYIDGDGDGVADAVLFTARVPASTSDTDVMVTELFDLATGDVTVEDALNASLGDTDTAIFDSDTFVMPVPLADIPGVTANKSRINYAVLAFDGYHSGPLDQVGDVDDDGTITKGLSLDVLHPGLTVTGSYNGNSSPLLYEDAPGSVLALRRDAVAYAKDRGLGALMVHFHNVVGAKAQIVRFAKSASATSLRLSPSPVHSGRTVTASIAVSGSLPGVRPSGTVTLKRLGSHPKTVGTATLVNGRAKVTFHAGAKGVAHYRAVYGGDAVYSASSSTMRTLVVKAKSVPRATLSVSANPVRHGHVVTITVRVAGSGKAVPTGVVTVRRLNGAHPKVVRRGDLVNGRVAFTYTPSSAGSVQLRAVYHGDSRFGAARSATVILKVT
jgi:subtilisin family serine protease